MELQIVREEESKQQPAADCHKEEQGQLTKKTRLSLKLLHELIRGLQHENFMLMQRVDELEKQFARLLRNEQEAAAARELQELGESQEEAQDAQEVQKVQGIEEIHVTWELDKIKNLRQEPHLAPLTEVPEPQPESDVPQPIRIPRSERHPSPKKNSFWPFRFHHRTILR